MIRFACENCGQQLKAADTCAGRQGRCPKCRQPVRIPAAEAASAAPVDDLLDLSHRPPTAEKEQTVGTPEDAPPEQPVQETPARFTDILVYPATLNGLVQIVILSLGLWLARFLGDLLNRFALGYGGLLGLICQVLVTGYLVFYLGYCIYDSAQGGRRAATVAPAHTPGAGDLLCQLLLLLAGVAVCLWPVALYRGLTERVDAWFWTLAGLGLFFLPMSLLTASLFDGIDALNPILILRSIVITLPAYVVLVVEFGLLSGATLSVWRLAPRLPVPRVVALAVCLYLLLMTAHLLGRYYRRWKPRLDWGL